MKLRYDDAQHAYWLDGKRCKSVTTLAKIPDDTFALNNWAKRQVAIGMAMRPDLVEAVAAHVEDDRRLDVLAEDAMKAAGSHLAAQRGTAAHRITELVDEGKNLVMTPLALSIATAWKAALGVAGFEIDDDLMERIVVYPEHRVCGKLDRIMRRRSSGRPVVVDLKTGAKAIQYVRPTSIQLAMYANAPLMAGPIPSDGGETTDFEPLPADLDRQHGYIVHMPAEGEITVAKVNIAAGWEAVQRLVWPVLDWRNRDDLVTDTRTVAVEPVAELDPFDGIAAKPEPKAAPERVAEVLHLWRAVETEGKRDEAIKDWPPAIAGPKRSEAWTDTDCSVLGIVLRKLLPFGVYEELPSVTTPVVIDPETGDSYPVKLDLGATLSPAEIAAVRRRFEGLTSDERAWIGSITSEARKAGTPIGVSAVPCERNIETARALVGLAHSLNSDCDSLADTAVSETVRAIAALTMGTDDPLMPSITIGAVLGAMSVDEARRFALHVDAYLAGGFAATFDDDGTMRFAPVVAA